VFRRKIFYLSGFDPRGARFYHQLFAEQAARFNAIAGRAVEVGKREKQPQNGTSWAVRDDDADAVTDYQFLGWDDLVRDHWVRSPAMLLAKTIIAYFNFVTQLDWHIVRRFPIGVRIAFFTPGVTLIVLPLLLGALCWLGAAALLGAGWGAAIALMLTTAAITIILRRIRGLWLLRFVIFNDALARDRLSAELHARSEYFTDLIAASLDEDWDEILFVTHSNGSIMAIPVMARLLAMRGGKLPDNFTFVTLGSCIGLIGNRRDSAHFHAALESVGQGDFRWVDIGSITDIICIANIDPCVSCKLPRRARLHQMSPRWFRYSDPATYAARKADRHNTHFDYLRSLDRLSPLDYIGVSSGARTIEGAIAEFHADIDLDARQAPSS